MAPSPSTSSCQVKVCGVREPSEARALDDLGVDWIGFNFHPGSPRFIEPAAAAPIIAALRRAVPVGIFVDMDPARAAEAIAVSGVRFAQLHGRESAAYIAAMPVPVIKAVPHDRLADLGGLRPALADAASAAAARLAYLLVDTQAQGAAGQAFGGTGLAFDWGLLAAHPLPRPLFLAGGLGPHNLAQALAAHPFAVDLNSKVETAPGRKDLAKVRACLDIARGN